MSQFLGFCINFEIRIGISKGLVPWKINEESQIKENKYKIIRLKKFTEQLRLALIVGHLQILAHHKVLFIHTVVSSVKFPWSSFTVTGVR